METGFPFGSATAMNILRLQKRLVSSVLCSGKKVRFDLSESYDITSCSFCWQVRMLLQHGLIMCKSVTVQSQAQCRKTTLVCWEGRHTGM